jgi:deoxyribodipyrimidine photo-lyase
MPFTTNYNDIIKQLDHIDPVSYARNRNFLHGDVTMLSPYISRGVISTKQVLNSLLARGFELAEIKKFLQELAWREYFQRAWQQLEEDLFNDIRHANTGVLHSKMPTAIATASTGFQSIDRAVQQLYKTGYMHNHLRMYVASIACNIAKAYWQMPSQWMYYHLLDGDLASNACNWQWVAGTFSGRKYYCNQDNINKYTNSHQQHTFLDKSYEELHETPVPDILKDSSALHFETHLPVSRELTLDQSLPLLLYNSYNLDPAWRQEEKANRILVLEPSHFKQYPVSEHVIQFILDLSKNIEGLQVFTGEVYEIPGLSQFPAIFSKEHPAFKHYPGNKDSRDWMFPHIQGFYSSFFSYWKKCEKALLKKEKEFVLAERA